MQQWDGTVEDQVEAWWATVASSPPEEVLQTFALLLEQFPNDPRALFEYASALDYAGQESEAIPTYEHAFAEGLDGDRRLRGLVQYASSLRSIGRVDEAVEVLEDAGEEFPGDPSILVFRGLALASAGRPGEAVAELIDVCVNQVDDLGLRAYAEPLQQYADELRIDAALSSRT